mgnify:CR=1 FL=1
MELRLDLHIHSERSFDGCMSLSEIVALARERGLNGVAICDHDRVTGRGSGIRRFSRHPRDRGSTERGHLLGLFVREPIETMKFSESVTAIHAQGGLAVIAHPFEHSTDANRLDDVMSRLDGVEIWNSRADRKNKNANAMARELAQKWKKPVTAGSDAHVPEEVGGGVTVLEADELSLSAVKAALLAGREAGRRPPWPRNVRSEKPEDQKREDKRRRKKTSKWNALYSEMRLAGLYHQGGWMACHGSLNSAKRERRSSRRSSRPRKSTTSATRAASSA